MKRFIRTLFGCCLVLGTLMLAGCSDQLESVSAPETIQEETDGAVVYGIITRVNGNEIEVELLTVSGAVGSGGFTNRTPGGMSGQQPNGRSRGEDGAFPSGTGGNTDRGYSMSGGRAPNTSEDAASAGATDGSSANQPVQPPSQSPDMTPPGDGEDLPQTLQDTAEEEKITLTNITGSSSSYTRTGGGSVLLVPVGTPVLTGVGENQKERTFNSLKSNYIIAITMKQNAGGTEYVAAIQVLQTS